MRGILLTVLGALALSLASCLQLGGETNAFLSFTDAFGPTVSGVTNTNGNIAAPGGSSGDIQFRRKITVRLVNNYTGGDLNTSLAAWVNTSSIRSAEQQDSLLREGYVPLTRQVQIGTVFTLPVGTFVLNGPGVAGATGVKLAAATDGAPTARDFVIMTPDVLLVYSEPPDSCESAAFLFTKDGDVITSTPVPGGQGTFEGATGTGGIKTLAQVSTYQCQPLKPGMFLKVGGGARKDNEFLEGENLQFDFNNVPNETTYFCVVTVGG